MVQVVSILDVPTMFGSVSFQSKEVSGAQNSEFRFYKTQNPEFLLIFSKFVYATSNFTLSVATYLYGCYIESIGM